MAKGKQIYFSLCLFVFFAVFYSLPVVNQWKTSKDSAIFISAANSLISGQGYRYQGILTYPPILFSLMLTPIIGIWGYNYAAMRLLGAMTGVAAIICTYILFRKNENERFAISILVLTAFAYPLLQGTTYILSDVPYMFFSLAALILIQAYLDEKKVLTWRGIVGGLFVCLAYLTRVVGISIFFAVICYVLVERFLGCKIDDCGKKLLLIAVMFFIVAGGWWLRGKNIANENRFVQEYEREASERDYNIPLSTKDFMHNMKYYAQQIGYAVIGPSCYVPGQTIIISLVFLIGLSYCLCAKRGICDYYVIFYIGIYLCFGGKQGVRYLVPIIPFIFYYLFEGILLLWEKIRLVRIMGENGKKVFLMTALSVLIVISHLWADIKLIKQEHTKPYYTGEVAHFMNVIEWVRENTQKGAVIVSDRAPWVHLMAQRYTVNFPREEDSKLILNSMRENKAEYLLYSPITKIARKYLKPVIKENKDRFQEIYREGYSVVYKVKEVQ